MDSDVRKLHQREYETILILEPTVAREQAERVTQRVVDVLAKQSAKLIRVEYWGKRKLAYRIKRCDWGFFYCLRFVGGGGLVAELERNFRMLDSIVRFQTILVKMDVEPETYQPAAADLEFRLDTLAKEAAEPIVESTPEGGEAPAAEAAPRPSEAPAAAESKEEHEEEAAGDAPESEGGAPGPDEEGGKP